MKLWHIISLVLAFALLGSCEQDPVVDDSPMPICFFAGEAAETKAIKPDDPTVLLKEGNQVSIFGTRGDNGSYTDIFVNRMLTCDAAPSLSTPTDPLSSTWSYTPLEYWKDDGDYYFSAVFPYNEDITIDNTYTLNVSYSAGENKDLMVARAYQDAAVSKEPVNLTFKHTTAAVRFLFGKSSASDADQYELTSFQLEYFIPSGRFKMLTRITAGSPNITLSDWTVQGTYFNPLLSWTADTPDDRKLITHPSDASNPDGYTAMGWYYMVPQELSPDASVRFSISYNGGPSVETVLKIRGVRDQHEESGTTWEPNQVYNYFITLNQSGLDLTVRRTLWSEVQVTTDDFNFE